MTYADLTLAQQSIYRDAAILAHSLSELVKQGEALVDAVVANATPDDLARYTSAGLREWKLTITKTEEAGHWAQAAANAMMRANRKDADA